VGVDDEVVVLVLVVEVVFKVLWLLIELGEPELSCEEVEESVDVEDEGDKLDDSEFVDPEPLPTTELLV
jgi:hypothetical protein